MVPAPKRFTSAVLEFHVLLSEKWDELIYAEVSENLPMPVECGRPVLSGFTQHFLHCSRLLAYILLSITDPVGAQELDDLMTPRTAGFHIENRKIFSAHAAMVSCLG